MPDMKEKVAAAMADKYWMDVLIRHESHPDGRAPGSRVAFIRDVITLIAIPDFAVLAARILGRHGVQRMAAHRQRFAKSIVIVLASYLTLG